MLLPAVDALADIVVTVEPPVRRLLTFDPDRRPSDMPPVASDGGATCSNVFEIEASIASSVEVVSPTTVRIYPENFAIVTRLVSTIYLPTGFPEKLRAHEEGHRAIGEHYYGIADSAARDAAAAVVGRPFEGAGADRGEAEQAAGRLVREALKDAYMKRTHARSSAANARFDALTDHGRNDVAEAVAIAAATAHDP